MAKGQTFLFIGPELGERADAIDDIRKSLQKAYGTPPEEHSLYAGEMESGALLSLLRNASLFSDARLIILKNVDQIKKKEDLDALAAYIKQAADDTTLILVSDETKVSKVLENAVPSNAKRIFWELFENRKIDWLNSYFRRKNLRVSEDAITAILDLVENNTEALRRECDKLCLFVDSSQLIDVDMVEDCLARSREDSAFTLFARIAEGDFRRSLDISRSLLDAKQSPVAILAGLAWCLRRLGDYVQLAESGRVSDFELKKIGLASKKAQKEYAAAARRYSSSDVQRAVALLAAYDIQLRSAGATLETCLLDIFLYRLIFKRFEADI